MEHSLDEKDNFPDVPLSGDIFGKIVKEVWKGKVKRVRRGSRGNMISNYIHLKQKNDPDVVPNNNMYESLDRKFNSKPRKNWSIIADGNERLSIVRLEKWEFDRQRVSTEISIEKGEKREIECKVKAHGCVVDLQKDLQIQVVDDLQNPCLAEHVENVINFIDNSHFCEGLKLLEVERITSLLPHHSGLMKDLT